MKEKVLTKNDLINIINEELLSFSEKINNDIIVENFAKKFSEVFVEALEVKKDNIRENILQDMTSFIKKYKNIIIESTVDPSFISNIEYANVLTKHKDRNISNLIEQSINTLKESNLNKDAIILEGDMFYGKEDNTVNISSYRGKEVILNTPFLGKIKKYKVYIESKDGIKCVEFGDNDMSIKKSDPSKSTVLWVCKKWINEGSFTNTLKKATVGGAMALGALGNVNTSNAKPRDFENSAKISKQGEIEDNNPFRNIEFGTNLSIDNFDTFIPELHAKYSEFFADSNSITHKLGLSSNNLVKNILRLGDLSYYKPEHIRKSIRQHLYELLKAPLSDINKIESNIQLIDTVSKKYSKYVQFLYANIIDALDNSSTKKEQIDVLRKINEKYVTITAYEGGNFTYVKEMLMTGKQFISSILNKSIPQENE